MRTSGNPRTDLPDSERSERVLRRGKVLGFTIERSRFTGNIMQGFVGDEKRLLVLLSLASTRGVPVFTLTRTVSAECFRQFDHLLSSIGCSCHCRLTRAARSWCDGRA